MFALHLYRTYVLASCELADGHRMSAGHARTETVMDVPYRGALAVAELECETDHAPTRAR